MSEADIHNANRQNLARLMIHDEHQVDDLAVRLQTENTSKSRYNSAQYVMTDLLLEGLSKNAADLLVLCGDQDAVSLNNLNWRESQIRSVVPNMQFELVAGVGHWLQYEKAEWFNQRVVTWIEQHVFS